MKAKTVNLFAAAMLLFYGCLMIASYYEFNRNIAVYELDGSLSCRYSCNDFDYGYNSHDNITCYCSDKGLIIPLLDLGLIDINQSEP